MNEALLFFSCLSGLSHRSAGEPALLRRGSQAKSKGFNAWARPVQAHEECVHTQRIGRLAFKNGEQLNGAESTKVSVLDGFTNPFVPTRGVTSAQYKGLTMRNNS